MDVANEVAGQQSTAREKDLQRAKLAALGAAVTDLAPELKAVVQLPADSPEWLLYVCRSYVEDGSAERTYCRMVNGDPWFFYEWGDPICQGDDIMRAARASWASA
jgi:hypothetical protein